MRRSQRDTTSAGAQIEDALNASGVDPRRELLLDELCDR
jgi:hypothetical protein